MKVKATVRCTFEIEYDSDSDDIEYVKGVIEMEPIDELLHLETGDSIQIVRTIKCTPL